MYDAKKVLMERDGLTEKEADREIDSFREAVLLSDNPFDAFDSIVDELCLEPDYLESILCI